MSMSLEVWALIQYLSGAGGIGRRRGCLFQRGLLFVHPLLEVVRRANVDHHRHEAVVAAAERGALTAVDAFLAGIHLEPELIDEARDRRALDAEIRYVPRMDHVLRSQDDP